MDDEEEDEEEDDEEDDEEEDEEEDDEEEEEDPWDALYCSMAVSYSVFLVSAADSYVARSFASNNFHP